MFTTTARQPRFAVGILAFGPHTNHRALSTGITHCFPNTSARAHRSFLNRWHCTTSSISIVCTYLQANHGQHHPAIVMALTSVLCCVKQRSHLRGILVLALLSLIPAHITQRNHPSPTSKTVAVNLLALHPTRGNLPRLQSGPTRRSAGELGRRRRTKSRKTT